MPKCPGVFRRKTSASYHFRRRIPLDLTEHYGRAVITFSLRTADYREACSKARHENVRLDQEFEEARAKRKAEIRTSLSDVEAERLALLLEHSMLRADEELREEGLDDFLYERMQVEHGERLGVFRNALARGDISVVTERVEDWLNDLLELVRSSDTIKALATPPALYWCNYSSGHPGHGRSPLGRGRIA